MKSSIKIIFSILLAVLLFGCQEQRDPNVFNITGQVNDYDGYMFLNYTQRGDSTYKVKDSVKVIDGTFQFTGSVPFPIQGYIHLQPGSTVEYFYIEPGEYTLYMKQQSQPTEEGPYFFTKMDSIVGSPTAAIKADFNAYRDSIKPLPNYNELTAAKVRQLVNDHPESPFTGKKLADLSYNSDFFSGEEMEELLAKIDTAVQAAFDLELIRAKIGKDKKFALGKPVGDISLPGLDNSIVDLDPTASEYTLVDFWASWCGPCIKKFPDYKEILAGTSREQLSIYGVSLDENTDNWRTMIDQRKLDWTQVIDSTAFDGPTAKNYFIIGIPRNFLIDSGGKILAIDIQPEELKEKFLNP